MPKDPVSYGSSFLAGLDPTGTKTFALAQKAKRHTGHKAVGVSGGVLGGLTLIPSAVGGVSGAAGAVRSMPKRLTKMGILSHIGKGIVRGIASPYKRVYHGVKSSRDLQKFSRGEKINTKGLSDSIAEAVGLESSGALKNSKTLAAIKEYTDTSGKSAIKNIREKGLPIGEVAADLQDNARLGAKALHREVKGKTREAVGALGASGLLGGGSSYLQYGQGKDVGDKVRNLKDRLNRRANRNYGLT